MRAVVVLALTWRGVFLPGCATTSTGYGDFPRFRFVRAAASALLLAATVCGAPAGEIYKWVDHMGRTIQIQLQPG